MTPRQAWLAVRQTLDVCTDWQWDRREIRDAAGNVSAYMFSGGRPCNRCEPCRNVSVLDAHFGEAP